MVPDLQPERSDDPARPPSLSAGDSTISGSPGPGTPRSRPGRRLTDGAAVPVLADLCGSGIAWRMVAITNAGAVLLALSLGEGLVIERLLHWLAVLEPILLISIVLLCLLRSRINGLMRSRQWLCVVLVPVLVAVPVCVIAMLAFEPESAWPHSLMLLPVRLVLVGFLAWLLLGYMHLRTVSMTPSLSEARLQALQARIRPHFLFNSLNTVLGLLRSEPRRAEFMLENLADLFRVFMRDTRDLVAIEDEVVTCRQYLAIEEMRLDGRLHVVWSLDAMQPDSLIPSLLLQPLIENAVHHGIEPVPGPGTITILIENRDDMVTVQVRNTMPSESEPRSGNQLGLANVRERLMLLYDTRARFSAGPAGDHFEVTLKFPYRKERRRYVRRTFNPDR